MDSKVLQVQQWLNKKYSSNANYTQITEDGNTGNETVTAIIKGFQIETGVTVDGKLGNGTLNAIGTLFDTSIATNRNKVYLLQGAMYCKGYEVNGFDGFYGNGVVKGVKEFKSDAGFSNPKGRSDAYTAISNVEKLGFKTGTIIYFAVDYDAIDAEVTSNILPYFKAISETFKKAVNKKGYRVGVYGARNICNRVSNLGYAQSSFVSDMSTGYSGNIGHLLPKNWAFDQISTVKLTMNGETVEADNNIMSGRYYGENEWDAVPVKKANPFLLFEYDSHVLTEKDRNIEAAREAVMARLETDEDFDWNYDPSDALLHFGDTTRKKEEYRYNYDEFSDENGVFNLFKDYLKPDKEPEVTLELVDYEYYSQKRINELNNGNKLAKFVASFLGGAGQVLSLLMTLTEAELEGEDVRKAFVRDVVDTTNEEAKSAVIETILLPANSSDIKATIFSTLYTLCVDGQSYYESLNEEKDHYITQYNYRPTGGTSGDDGQSKFVIYVGDSMVQLRYLVNGVYQGDYYVYLRNYVPKCVWFYSVKFNE